MSVDRLRELLEKATEFAPGYLLTPEGEVWSVESNWRGYGPRKLKPTLTSDGYQRVRCNVNGKRRAFYIHREIAKAFLPPRPSLAHQLRHLNGRKDDNRVLNLAWGTAADNAADRELHGRTARGSRNGFARLNDDAVREIQQLLALGVSHRELGRRFGVTSTTVGLIHRGETWRHVGVPT